MADKIKEQRSRHTTGFVCSICHKKPVCARTYYRQVFCTPCFHKYIWSPPCQTKVNCSGDIFRNFPPSEASDIDHEESTTAKS